VAHVAPMAPLVVTVCEAVGALGIRPRILESYLVVFGARQGANRLRYRQCLVSGAPARHGHLGVLKPPT
jgi:hypothetical protein